MLPTCLFICLFLLSIYLCVYLFVYISVYVYAFVFIYFYTCLSLPSYIHSSFFFLPSFLPYFFILPPSSSLSLYLCRYFSLIKAMRIYILCLAALRTLALLSVIIYLHLHWTPKPQTCFQLSLSDYLRVTVLELPLA